ncbi:MAG: 30S ribosomal protein S6 [candidate division Zixibacteria bacterium]|nr:30S ribosomal protein S6 [candidate division Zixibacteria bacterium]
MKTYELTFILNPNLDKELVNAEIEKITSHIEAGNGKILEVQHLGMKKMTFEIQGSRQGNYYTIYYQADPEVLKQLEPKMKLNEAILRFLTIVLKPSEYVSPVKEEKKAPEPELVEKPAAEAEKIEVKEDDETKEEDDK